VTKFYDLVRVNTATTGTGTITLGSAVSGFKSFSGAGVVDGASVRYGILDGANSEVGIGVYSSSGGTLTRTVTASTNSNSAISLSGTAQVFITLAAEDFNFASLSDVDMATTAPASGNVPTFNGTKWVPAEPVAHAAPTQVQIATNIGNRVISATNSATLASAPTVGNTLLAFVSGLAPGAPVQSGWTTLGSYGASFQQIYVYSRIVAAGDPSTWSFANSGDYMNVAVIELSGVLSLAATVGYASISGWTLSSPAVAAATPALAYNMIEFANNTTLSSEASGWTSLGYFGELTHNHNATLIKTSSAFSTVSPAAPAITTTSDPSSSAVYATVVVCGKLTTKLGDLYDSNAAAAADGQVLKYKAATNEWVPVDFSMTAIAGNPGTSGSLTNNFALCFSLSTYNWNWAELATVAITGNFSDLGGTPTNASYSLHGLSDVNVTEGSGINGYVLTWNNATNKWIASAASGGGSSTLASMTDVNVTEGSGINGYALAWDYATSKWIAKAVAGVSGVNLLSERIAPPLASAFSALTQGSTAMTAANSSDGTLVLSYGAYGSSSDFRGVVKAAPTASTYSIIARVKVMLPNLNYGTFSLFLYNSANGKSVQTGWLGSSSTSNAGQTVVNYGSSFSWSSNLWLNENFNGSSFYEWLRIDVTSTTLTFYMSQDGDTWIEQATASISSFIGAITHVGFGGAVSANPVGGGSCFAAHVLYYSDPDITPSVSYPGGNASAISSLTDVSVTEGSGIDKLPLTWDQASGKWIAMAPLSPFYQSGSIVTPTTASFANTYKTSGFNAVANGARGVAMLNPTGSADATCLAVNAIPSTPYTVIALGQFVGPAQNYSGWGICAVDSSNSKNVAFLYDMSGNGSNGTRWDYQKQSAVGTYNGDTNIWNACGQRSVNDPVWIKVQDDGTNFIAYFSYDGEFWTKLKTVSRTDYLTPTQIGIGCYGIQTQNIGQYGMYLLSYQVLSGLV